MQDTSMVFIDIWSQLRYFLVVLRTSPALHDMWFRSLGKSVTLSWHTSKLRPHESTARGHALHLRCHARQQSAIHLLCLQCNRHQQEELHCTPPGQSAYSPCWLAFNMYSCRLVPTCWADMVRCGMVWSVTIIHIVLLLDFKL